ncbi:MAG: class I SAM-dependent methyltransferase [Thermomicrobiales bacterium]
MRVEEELLAAAGSDALTGSTLTIGGTAGLVEALVASGQTVSWLPLDVREAIAASPAVVVLRDPGMPLSRDVEFGAVVMPAPPERDLGRRWLMLARNHLAPDGRLTLAGANASGIRSTIADGISLFGEPLREDYRSKHRVATFVAGGAEVDPPAWATEPGIAEGTWNEVVLDADGCPLRLATLPGVFAGTRLDVGTVLLLAHLAVKAGERVLDVGCGAGAIGFSALRRGAHEMVMTDVNLLAVAAVRETIRRDGIAAARVMAGDVYDGLAPGERFDLIVSNPPFHQGKTVDYEMPQRLVREAASHLSSDGRLVIVANAFLPYERLLEDCFRVVQELANTRRFKVLLATRPR